MVAIQTDLIIKIVIINNYMGKINIVAVGMYKSLLFRESEQD